LASTAREIYWLENQEKWQLLQYSAETVFFSFFLFSFSHIAQEHRKEFSRAHFKEKC
jgi:lipid-A-disaccharide synthase-like uncharacterized protein